MRRRLSDRAMRLMGLALIVAGSLTFVGGRTVATAAAPLTPPPCPEGWTCVAMPCPTEGACGTVQVGPTSNLGVDQWVFVRLFGFTPGDTIGTYYCQDTGTLAPSPACALEGTQLLSNPSTVVKPFADGSSAFGFNVPVVDSASGTPLVGGIPPAPPSREEFYCSRDDACAIEISSRMLSAASTLTPSPTNAVRIPIAFAPSNTGCPNGAIISTESEFGIERLLPRVSSSLCSGSDPAVPFNTALNGLEAVKTLAAGSIEMAFTDDPQAPSQAAELKKGNFILIPLVTSANVMGFRSQTTDGFSIYPKATMNLTATAAGGILTGLYQGPTNADLAPCNGPCPLPVKGPCFHADGPCSFFDRLNFSKGFFNANTYGAYLRSDTAGVTSQMFSWICSMPTTTADFSGPITESVSGTQALLDGLSTGTGSPVTSCPVTDQFPPMRISGEQFAEVNSPGQQVIKMSKTVLPFQVASQPNLGLAPMNWAEARYYGMSIASLQNAAGGFVPPTVASVNAALADGTWNANGTISPSYSNTSSSAAYAMPTVIYAAVNQSTKVPKADQKAIRSILSKLLDVTTGATGTLPEGFVPLNADLTAIARDEVAHAIGNPTYQVKVPQKPGMTPPPGTVSAPRPSTYRPTVSAVGIRAGAVAPGAQKGSGAGLPKPIASSSPTYGAFRMTAAHVAIGTNRILLLGGIVAIVGALLMAWRPTRSRLGASTSPSDGDLELETEPNG